ncbi:hypothetical protein V5O48_013152, partial [Marasmius crinis-equi]
MNYGNHTIILSRDPKPALLPQYIGRPGEGDATSQLRISFPSTVTIGQEVTATWKHALPLTEIPRVNQINLIENDTAGSTQTLLGGGAIANPSGVVVFT